MDAHGLLAPAAATPHVSLLNGAPAPPAPPGAQQQQPTAEDLTGLEAWLAASPLYSPGAADAHARQGLPAACTGAGAISRGTRSGACNGSSMVSSVTQQGQASVYGSAAGRSSAGASVLSEGSVVSVRSAATVGRVALQGLTRRVLAQRMALGIEPEGRGAAAVGWCYLVLLAVCSELCVVCCMMGPASSGSCAV